MFKRNRSYLTLVLITVMAFSACKDSKENLEAPEFLVDATRIGTMTSQQIRQLMLDPVADQLASNTIDAWRVVYNTKTPAGADVQASGLVIIPRRAGAPYLSLHRGTTFIKSEAPSNLSTTVRNTNAGWVYFAPVLASSGYIVVMPDQLGFGTTSNMQQPFFVTGNEGRVSVDLLKAARELVVREKASATNRLFISGYSQGGSTVLSVVKTLQNEPNTAGFSIVAAAAGGGAYNLPDVARAVLSQQEVGFAPFLALLINSYRTYYFPDRALNTIFREPYASRLTGENLLGGTLGGPEILARLTNTTADLFTESFLTAFLGDGEVEMKARLSENDLSNFAYTAHIRLYHGAADEIIPVAEVQRAFNAMLAAGSTNMMFIPPFENAGHLEAGLLFGNASINWFAFL
jgi:alpha-beta hydrolase superfamily lysophospholipase